MKMFQFIKISNANVTFVSADLLYNTAADLFVSNTYVNCAALPTHKT